LGTRSSPKSTRRCHQSAESKRDTRAVTTDSDTLHMESHVTLTRETIVVEHLELHDPQLAAFVGERATDERYRLVERALRIGLETICNAGVSLTTDRKAAKTDFV
jgi:hypothetical protein